MRGSARGVWGRLTDMPAELVGRIAEGGLALRVVVLEVVVEGLPDEILEAR